MEANFKKDDIIIWCNEEFIVIENYGESGIVKENCKNGDIINNFRWNFQGEKAILKEE